MNKKLIAMAVAAGLAAPMAANAAPTLYGHLQVEVASFDDGKETQANDGKGTPGSSRLKTDDNKRGRMGVKGSEDLGGGMNAIYNFEFQVETTQGDVDDGNRVGMVGLKGGFGTVMAGSLKTPYKYYGGVKYDPFVGTFLEARSRGGMSGKSADGSNTFKSDKDTKWSGGASGAFGQHGFMTDAISYKNKFGPIELWANTSLDEDGGGKGANGDTNIGVKFSGGSFEAFVAMAHDDQVKYTAGAANAASAFGAVGKDDIILGEYDATKFGGSFKMGPHKIKAQMEQTELALTSYYVDATSTTSTLATTIEGDHVFVGYELKLGKNVVVVNYGSADYDGTKVDYLTVGAIHKFSKKSRVFAGHTSSDDDGTEQTALSVGLRVDF